MIAKLGSLLAAILLLATGAAHAQTAAVAKPVEKLPAAAFAKLPFIEQPKLSPDGAHLAGLIAVGGEQRLVIMPVVGDRSSATMIKVPDLTEVGSMRWVNDDHVIVQLYALMPIEGENLFRSQWAKMSHDFAAVSPINAIDRITAPLLLIHGKKDVTVDHSQSNKMHAAMRRAGKPTEFLSLPLADHYFTREADRLALLEAMATFLARHNPPE